MGLRELDPSVQLDRPDARQNTSDRPNLLPVEVVARPICRRTQKQQKAHYERLSKSIGPNLVQT